MEKLEHDYWVRNSVDFVDMPISRKGGTLEDAKAKVFDYFKDWIEQHDNTCFEYPDDEPYDWDCMIDNESAWVIDVARHTDDDGNYEDDDFVWEPTNEELRAIGWVFWDERSR